jgi:hypothetical protein
VGPFAELNGRTGGWPIEDLARTICGRLGTVGEPLDNETDLRRPPPAEAFDTAEHDRPRLDTEA